MARSDVRASSARSSGQQQQQQPQQQQQRRRQDAKNALNEIPYYHSHVGNSQEALKVLTGRPVGTFILRNCSGKHKGFCAVSVIVELDDARHSDRILRHFDICLHNGSFFFERKRPFKSLQALVDYYGKYDVPNSQGVVGVRLSSPLSRLPKSTRQPPPLPADAVIKRDVTPDSSLQSQQPMTGVYSYACCPDRTDVLITRLEQQQQELRQSSRRGPRNVSESSNGSYARCACGILLSDGALPRGWTVHQNVRERVIFYKGPDNVSQWMLPPEIDSLLSDQHRDFIEQLKVRVLKGDGYGGNL